MLELKITALYGLYQQKAANCDCIKLMSKIIFLFSDLLNFGINQQAINICKSFFLIWVQKEDAVLIIQIHSATFAVNMWSKSIVAMCEILKRAYEAYSATSLEIRTGLGPYQLWKIAMMYFAFKLKERARQWDLVCL